MTRNDVTAKRGVSNTHFARQTFNTELLINEQYGSSKIFSTLLNSIIDCLQAIF